MKILLSHPIVVPAQLASTLNNEHATFFETYGVSRSFMPFEHPMPHNISHANTICDLFCHVRCAFFWF